LALTSSESCGCSVGIFRLRTKAKEFVFVYFNRLGAKVAQSVERLATGLTTEGQNLNIDKGKIFVLSALSRPILGTTKPPKQWAPSATSGGVKRQERETNHSPPTTTEIKNACTYTSAYTYAFME
jgi:hypothetical protein